MTPAQRQAQEDRGLSSAGFGPQLSLSWEPLPLPVRDEATAPAPGPRVDGDPPGDTHASARNLRCHLFSAAGAAAPTPTPCGGGGDEAGLWVSSTEQGAPGLAAVGEGSGSGASPRPGERFFSLGYRLVLLSKVGSGCPAPTSALAQRAEAGSAWDPGQGPLPF